MSDFVYWDILESVRTQLVSGNVDLTGEGDCEDIDSASVVIRNNPVLAGDPWNTDETTPGILIIPSWKVRSNVAPYIGNIGEDDIRYPFAIQVIDDSEQSRYEEDQLKSWIKWSQKIRQYLLRQNLRNEVFDSDGYVDVVVEPMQGFDEREFVRHNNTVFAMVFEAISREPRNAAGSV